MRPVVSVWIAALWWGSLTTVGFGVVPMLFAHLPSPSLAGNMAAKLFAAQTWVAVVCGLILLIHMWSNQPLDQADKGLNALIYVAFGTALALVSEFAVSPRIVARENLRLWHSLGSVMYVLQWVCAAMTLHKLLSNKPK
jgi:uncharacterized membrane protein